MFSKRRLPVTSSYLQLIIWRSSSSSSPLPKNHLKYESLYQTLFDIHGTVNVAVNIEKSLQLFCWYFGERPNVHFHEEYRSAASFSTFRRSSTRRVYVCSMLVACMSFIRAFLNFSIVKGGFKNFEILQTRIWMDLVLFDLNFSTGGVSDLDTQFRLELSRLPWCMTRPRFVYCAGLNFFVTFTC